MGKVNYLIAESFLIKEDSGSGEGEMTNPAERWAEDVAGGIFSY